jgi:hypothetical protein
LQLGLVGAPHKPVFRGRVLSHMGASTLHGERFNSLTLFLFPGVFMFEALVCGAGTAGFSVFVVLRDVFFCKYS